MAIKLDSGFEILRHSDLGFEEMTILILFNDQDVAQLNADRGFGQIEIEIFFNQASFAPRFPLNDFLEALKKAESLLLEYA